MKLEEKWPRGYRGKVVQRCGRTTSPDDGRQVITIAHPETCSGELKMTVACTYRQKHYTSVYLGKNVLIN